MRFSGPALTESVEAYVIDGVTVRATSVARTVAGGFKFRNKIGLDVAITALREAWNGRRMTSDEIGRYARIDRMTRIMRPYRDGLA